MTPARIAFGLAATAGAAAMLLGSWAPFHLHRATFAEVWQAFLGTGASLGSARGDLVANILLSVPFAFAFLGFLQTDRRQSVTTRVITTILTMVVAIGLSLICELGQGWLGSRVPSIRDSMAQFLGAAIGCAAWLLGGARLTPLLNRLFSAERIQTRSQAATTLVAIGVLVWAILPGDVLTSPTDVARKWANGRIELIPFTRSDGSLWDSLYQWVASVCLAVPLGLWVYQFVSLTLRRSLQFAEWLLVALCVGMLPELLQVPIRGRIASSTDALFGVLGAAAGIWLGHRLLGTRHSEQPRRVQQTLLRQPAIWLLAAAAYWIVLCMLSWYPFDFVTDSDQIRALLGGFIDDPFSDYRGSNLRILFVFARLIVLSIVLGGLAGVGAGLIRDKAMRIATLAFMMLLGVAASCVLELGQLLEESHSGAGLGLVTRLVATLTGLVIGLFVCRGDGFAATARLEAATGPTRDNSQLGPSRDMPTPSREMLGANSVQKSKVPAIHVPGMDGLRAIACLAVFGVHWHQMTGVGSQWGPIDFARLLENGNTGVAMFMILSGFLLALPLFASSLQMRSQYSLKKYWNRRAVRILPAYYLCLFALVIATFYWRSIGRLLDILLHTFFLHNFTATTLYSINPPFWALAPIVQFYALFAILVLVLKQIGRLSDASLLVTCAAIAVLSQCLVACLALASPTSATGSDWIGPDAICMQHSLASHVSIFVLGVFAAWAHLRLGKIQDVRADAVVLACAIACIGILATPIDDVFQFPGGRYNFPVVPVLLTAILLAASRATVLGPVLGSSVIRRLGVVSYGFYLFHLPLMKLLRKVLGEPWVVDHPFLFAIVSITFTVVASEVSYRWVEQPVARMVSR